MKSHSHSRDADLWRKLEDSMKTQFEQMMNGLNDVEAFLAGKQAGFKGHVPQEIDVKAIRNRLGRADSV